MATIAQTQVKAPAARPLQLWHLLSLDAPTVAALWTLFVSRSVHLHLTFRTPSSMFFAVWILYAADRLLDARALSDNPFHVELEARHHFHSIHRTWFLVFIGISAAALSALLPAIPPEALHLYLILGALLGVYFILIHATPAAPRLPKEFAVGFFFSAAVFIPTVARRADLRLPLLPAAILFALLCSLNCLFIYAWEHPPHQFDQKNFEPHRFTRLAIRFLPEVTSLTLALSLAFTLIPGPWPHSVATACFLSAGTLLCLHHFRMHLSRLTLRASADLALLTPLLLLAVRHPA